MPATRPWALGAAALLLLHALPISASADGLSADQKQRADRLISLFENDTPEVQYAYVERLGDGRGYTAGRGLTTGTGDVLEAVRDYVARVPGSDLARYLPRLEELAEAHSDDVSGLDGFPAAWAAAAADPTFRASQDAVNDRESYRPAMQLGDTLGLRTPLARVALYDTVFTHGLGADGAPDGTLALVQEATARAGGSPAGGVNERAWLTTFLAVRRADMAHAHDAATRAVWAQAVGRVDTLAALAASGNDAFAGPLAITGEHTATLP